METWRIAFNSHKIRTEGHRTPNQLFHSGITSTTTESTAISNIMIPPQNVRRKISEFLSTNELQEPTDIEHVLPNHPLPLTRHEIMNLKSTIDTSRHSEYDGMDIYLQVLHYVEEKNA